MARPSAEEMGRALTAAYKAAGIVQKDIARATGTDQSTVSAWVRGENWPPLHVLPIIDELCRQPRGHILRLAGFVDDDKTDIEAAIEAESGLAWHEKDVLIFLYNRFRTRSAET